MSLNDNPEKEHCCCIYSLRGGILTWGYITLVWYAMNAVELIVDAVSDESTAPSVRVFSDVYAGYCVAKTLFKFSFYAAVHKIWYMFSLTGLFEHIPRESYVNYVIFQTYLVVNWIFTILILITTHLNNVILFRVCCWYCKILLVLFMIWAGILVFPFIVRECPAEQELYYPLLIIVFFIYLSLHAYFTLMVQSQLSKLEECNKLPVTCPSSERMLTSSSFDRYQRCEDVRSGPDAPGGGQSVAV